MKGKPVVRGGGESKPKPKRGKREGSPEAKPKWTTSYLQFQKIARKDMYRKLGGKEGVKATLRGTQQLTTKADLPGHSTSSFVRCAVADMWNDAPKVVKEDFRRQAALINAREEERFAVQQQLQYQQQQQQQKPEKMQCHTPKEDTVRSHARETVTKEADDIDNDGGDDMAIASTASGSEDEGVRSSTASDSEDKRLVSYTVNDSEDEKLVPYTASESECEGLVPYTESDDSEDEPIASSRPASGRGTTARKAASAVRRASHPPVASEMAQTKEKDQAVGKQRASKSVPLVSRFALDLYDVRNVGEPAVSTASPPGSTPCGKGRGHTESPLKTPDSSACATPPSAEVKSPRPANGRKNRADDAKDSCEPSACNVGCSPKKTETPPRALAVGSKTKARKKAYVSADKEISEAGKRAGLEAVGAVLLRTKTLAATEQTPGKTTRGRRAASLDGRPARSSSVSNASRKRRASVSATRAKISSSEKPGASRTKVWKRVLEAETSVPKDKPSASKGRNPSRERPSTPKSTGRAEKERLRPTRTQLNPPKKKTLVGKGTADKARAITPTEAPKTPKTLVTRLVHSTNDGGGGAASGAARGIAGGGVGGNRTGGIPERRREGGVPDNGQTGSGEDAMSETGSEDTWPDVGIDETGSEEEEDVSSDDMREDSDSGEQGGGSGAGVARGGLGVGTGIRLTHKKKVWHAGLSAPTTLFGLIREKDAKIEVLWEVERKPHGTTEKVWLAASVDLVDVFRTGDVKVDGRPLWNIHYERHLSIPASKSQVAFLSENELRDVLEWDEEEECWIGEPLAWRPKQGEA